MLSSDLIRRAKEIEAVELPDGRRAASLRPHELHRALAARRIPGIAPDMGKQALLAAYAARLDVVAADLRGPLPASRTRALAPKDLSQTMMRRAAAVIAGMTDSLGADPSRAPAGPHHTMTPRE